MHHSTPNIAALLSEPLISIVKEASELMLTDTFSISSKGGFSNIVTSSDIAVQEFLCNRLQKLLPDSGFLCEEKDLRDISHEYTWIIDPIDGTANYSRGISDCAICVALKHNEDIEMGVVYIPMADKLFSACKGKGAYLDNRRITVSERQFADSIMCTALPVYHKEHAQLCADIICDTFSKCNDIRRFGACAPELCRLAMGQCELYFEYLLNPWDFAAASLILTEAGGIITDLNGQKPSFTSQSGIIAANNAANHRQLLGIVSARMDR